MPAPSAENAVRRSTRVTSQPRAASASAAVSPPMPAPAMTAVPGVT